MQAKKSIAAKERNTDLSFCFLKSFFSNLKYIRKGNMLN